MHDDDNFLDEQFDKPQALCCKECKQIKPVADCILHSGLCKACHYKPRKPTEMTKTELLAKAHARKLNPGLVEQILETRERNAKKKMSEAARKAHAKKKGWMWDEMIDLRNSEQRKARAAYKYATNPKNGYRQYDAEFYAEYLEVLERIGGELRRNKRNGTTPTVERWEQLITQAEQRELRRLWANIPPDNATARGRKRRIPAALEITTRISGELTDADYGIPTDDELLDQTNTATPSDDLTGEKPSPFKGLLDDLM